MSTRWLFLAPVLISAALAQTDSAITQEGRHWVQTSSGTLPAHGDLLRVAAQGAVSVRGEARADIAYTLKKRVRARDEAHARQVLSSIGLKSTRRGGWAVLELELPDRYTSFADVTLRVPRKLREVRLETPLGAIQGYDLEGAVRAETGAGTIEMDRVSGSVSAGSGSGSIRLGKTEGSVKAFTGAGSITAQWIGGEADLSTGGGQIHVVAARGPVRASASGGNIRVERSELGVRVSAGAGLIDVAGAKGPVFAETGSGTIKVQSAGNVICQSGAGAIHLYSVYGGLRASTGSGSIVAELTSAEPLKDSALSTAMGDITVYIPSNLPVTVQAINTSPGGQRILSDFAEIRPQAITPARAQADGELNGGGPLLRLTATGGTIYLRRKN